MATLASDNFNRANGGLGANWTTVTGLDGPQIVGNLVQPNQAAVVASAYYNSVSWPNDQWGQVAATKAITDSNRDLGVHLRVSASAYTCYAFRAKGPLGASATLEIDKYIAGAKTSLYSGTQTINAGATLYGEVQGTSILAKVNGTQLGGTQSDSAIASGNCGVRLYTNTAVTDTQLDDWSGGDFGPTTVTGSFSGDAVLLKSLASSFSANAVLRKLGLSGSLVADAFLRNAQWARPVADARLGGWKDQADGTTNIYLAIDEAAASDADYIKSAAPPSSDAYVAKLSSVTDPASSSGHAVHWRCKKDSAGSPRIDLTVELRQGYASEASPGTLIATAATLVDIPSAWTSGGYWLSGSECDAITNYGDLYLRFVANKP